ncbi:MAG: type II toxin-antitoxin system RelE/ParE family toxin [Thermoleophilaceae bacterium]
MPWVVEYTDEFEDWWEALTGDEQERVTAAVEVLEDVGPGLGRPLVDTLKGSRHEHMKELRPPSGHLRVLFAFDPRRVAILLIGGDKSGRWSEWYQRMVPMADRLFDEHLQALAEEGTP